MTMPVVNESFTINCLQKDVYSLKTPAVDPVLFVGKPVAAIVRKVMPGVDQIIGAFPSGRDYHLLSGERPSKLLRQVAREMGARVFYQRNKVFMQRLSDMLKADVSFTYAYEDRQADYKVIHYSRPNVDHIVADVLVRDYRGWLMTEGLLRSGKHQGAPSCFVSGDSLTVLDNLSVLSVPEVDFVVSGSGALRPGATLGLEWNLNRRDAPLDESLPAKIVIGTCSHFYSYQKYLTRIKGVLPL